MNCRESEQIAVDKVKGKSVTNKLNAVCLCAGLIIHSAAVHPHGRADPEDAGVCSCES